MDVNNISISQAWSYATSFFSGRAAEHAIALIGVGIAVPLILQLALGGGMAAFDPARMTSGAGAFAAFSGFAILLGLVNYILQTGSYFASWRLGFSDGQENVGGALSYGLIAALPVLLFTAAILFVIGIIGFLLFGGAFAPALLNGRQPSRSALAGMGFAMLILVPLFLLFIVWLAARQRCTGPIMADKRTFNVLTGLSESWRITGAAQWKIFAYFILLGIAFLVIAMILGAVVGFSVFASGGMPGAGSMVGLIVGSIVMSIPVAYLQVGIPAGIYRALGPVDAGSVFA